MNNTPCVIPTILVGSGISPMYLRGIQTNISITREIPSSNAANLNICSVFNVKIFIKNTQTEQLDKPLVDLENKQNQKHEKIICTNGNHRRNDTC